MPIREIILDTETTGLSSKEGDRLIEIGAIELVDKNRTGRTFHKYLNPQRLVSEGALEVHGLSDEFLADKPLFAEIVQDFLAFIQDSTLVIHNAPFDMEFLNSELRLLNLPLLDDSRTFDTLHFARQKFPGAKASLDALCSRFNLSNSHRKLHGALLDADLLVDVYIELTGGYQTTFDLNGASDDSVLSSTKTDYVKDDTDDNQVTIAMEINQSGSISFDRISQEEHENHAKLVSNLGKKALWNLYKK